MPTTKPKPKSNAPLWILEPLLDDPGFIQSRMFGIDTAYLDGKIYLAIGGKHEPWNGLMVCTSREHHAALLKRVPQLTVHPVLGKWLYISQTHRAFEGVALEVTEMARRRDPLLGVEPKTRKRPLSRRSTERSTS
jgi:hypothetical protein